MNPPLTNLRYFTCRLLRASSCCFSQYTFLDIAFHPLCFQRCHSRKKMSPTHHERYTNLNCLLHRCMTRYTTHLSCSSVYSLVSSPSFTDCLAPRLKRSFVVLNHTWASATIISFLSTYSFRFPSSPTNYHRVCFELCPDRWNVRPTTNGRTFDSAVSSRTCRRTCRGPCPGCTPTSPDERAFLLPSPISSNHIIEQYSSICHSKSDKKPTQFIYLTNSTVLLPAWSGPFVVLLSPLSCSPLEAVLSLF